MKNIKHTLYKFGLDSITHRKHTHRTNQEGISIFSIKNI